MTKLNLISKLNNLKLDVDTNHIHIEFDSPVEILSSAVLNGGFVWANHILNMKVGKKIEASDEVIPPDTAIQKYTDSNGWNGKCVGMMTAASMNSFRSSYIVHEDIIVECFVTVGISNARRAGDPADIKSFRDSKLDPGTINIILGTNAKLSESAMVEAIMIISEAKAAAMQELNILSPVSEKIATGTGTDSIVVFNGCKKQINYCGKHVLFGEMIARVVSKSIKDSLDSIN